MKNYFSTGESSLSLWMDIFFYVVNWTNFKHTSILVPHGHAHQTFWVASFEILAKSLITYIDDKNIK